MFSHETLQESQLKLLKPLSLAETYRVIVEEGINLSNSVRGIIFAKTSDGFRKILSLPYTEDYSNPRKNGFTNKVFMTGKSLILRKKHIIPKHPESADRPGSTFTFIPLNYESTAQGVLLLVSNHSTRKAEKYLELLELFANIASMAITKAVYEENLKNEILIRDNFISIANHELKTPITSILSYAQLIQRSVVKGKTPPVEWLNKLLYEIKNQTDLINDMIIAHEIKGNDFALNFQSVNLSQLLDLTISAFGARSSSHKILFQNKLNFPNDLLIADTDKLEQAFSNIIRNAAKYSPSTQPVKISASEKGRNYIISIKDTGEGIDSIDLPHIFDYQYRGKHTAIGGMGIGLFITKKIIDAHNGKISVTSDSNGTQFMVSLPKV